jgi:hypothetical protein
MFGFGADATLLKVYCQSNSLDINKKSRPGGAASAIFF